MTQPKERNMLDSSGPNRHGTDPPLRITSDLRERDILVHFSRKPSTLIREDLKSSGFIWSPERAGWSAMRTPETEALARSLADPLPRNAILSGDCTEVMKHLPSHSVDLVLTDPPYLANYNDRSGRFIRNDVHGDWIAPAFAEVHRLLKPDSFCISFYGWHSVETFMRAWREAGFRPVGQIIWPKPYAASSSSYLVRQHEQAYLLAKGRPPVPHNAPSDVQPWHYTGNRLHPTQKAVQMLSPLIEAFSPPHGLVLDPFCGSGSTALAAKRLGRAYLGIEIDPGFACAARRRLR
jgi:site-specific DNA-methyltransferase (adenine-specific)